MKTVLYYILSILVSLMLTGIAYSQTIWHVDDDAVGPGSGTEPDPFPNIKGGVEAAAPGDIVMVHDGYYTGLNNADIRPGKPITIKSKNGPATTIIDCTGIGKRAFSFSKEEGPNTIVDGFTITGGNPSDYDPDKKDLGGAILCAATESYPGGASPTIINNIITGNIAAKNGGGIFCYNSSPTIENNIIVGNKAGQWGGAILCAYNSSPTIVNNIIAGNYAEKYGGAILCSYGSLSQITYNTITGNWTNAVAGGGVVSVYGSAPTVLNSILWKNSPDEISVVSAAITVTYSDIRGGWTGEGNINDDPLFVDPNNGNYYLQAGSPCLSKAKCDATTITTDIDGHSRPLGSGCDMGSYEQCDSGFIYGDVSWNCNVTAFDASLVLQYVIGSIRNLSRGQRWVADVTGNGAITALDAALILQYTVGLISKFPVQGGVGAPILTSKTENELLIDALSKLEIVSLNREQEEVMKQLRSFVSGKLPIIHTTLLQNYPNPFNPETWIPYRLVQNALVTIHIYNIEGQLIRSLRPGMKQAGSYITKGKAAYWDGRDDLAQKVASGVYFYTMQVEYSKENTPGKYTETRRMVILK